jgi:hypothetical protein
MASKKKSANASDITTAILAKRREDTLGRFDHVDLRFDTIYARLDGHAQRFRATWGKAFSLRSIQRPRTVGGARCVRSRR